jgi:maltose alpha-D-glucosyltransferase/alpha-amylase
LGEKGFPHVPAYEGEIRCRFGDEEGVLGLLTNFIKNQGDGWHYMVDAASRFFERVLSEEAQSGPSADLEEFIEQVIPQRARQLGDRTAALHTCLASVTEKPEFAPEPFTGLYQRSLYQTMRSLLRRTETEVTRKLPDLDPETRAQAMNWLTASPRIMEVYLQLIKRRIITTKIRVHGDYHLGQVLNTGNDFVILDFEGEPKRSLGERLLKRSPLVDVAGMLRSFDYAVEVVLNRQKQEDRQRLRPWAAKWLDLVSTAFIEGYRERAAGASFLPSEEEDFRFLLLVFLLDKSVYEIGYELSYRPDFLPVPIGAAGRLLATQEFTGATP